MPRRDKTPKKPGKVADRLAGFAERFEIPADALVNMPRIELIGNRELFIDGHYGIIVYSDEEIRFATGSFACSVKGKKLYIRTLTPNEATVFGDIASVEFVI